MTKAPLGGPKTGANPCREHRKRARVLDRSARLSRSAQRESMQTEDLLPHVARYWNSEPSNGARTVHVDVGRSNQTDGMKT
jgi:hypothetical protein